MIRIGVGSAADVLGRQDVASLNVLLFPELMDGGYAAVQQGKPPHSIRDPFISNFKTLSITSSCCIIAGSTFLRDKTSKPTNTSLAFSRGKIIHRYDKIHLFGPTGDPKYFGRGKLQAKTFRLPIRKEIIRCGVVICYDLRFPELVRAMALKGMQILFVPARWPAARDDAWFSLLKARAIENQIFVVGCNAQDNEGGHSYAFNPLGEMIFSTRGLSLEALRTFEIDTNRIAAARTLHQNLKEARFLRNLLR